MEILELQIIFLSSIFTGTLFFSLIPLLCLRRAPNANIGQRTNRLLSYLSCVAAGVFIAMCFLGLLPLVEYQFETVLKQLQFHTEFPVAEAVVVLGFFFILTIEQLCLKCYKPPQRSMATADFELRGADDAESIRKLLDEDFDGEQDVLYDVNSHHRNPIDTNNSRKKSPVKNGSTTKVASTPRKADHCRHFSQLTNQKLGLRFCILVLALSIHAVFEGLALGLVKDKSKALHLFIAMLLHESICAFALGVNMAKRRLTMGTCFLYVLFFSLTVPSGVGFGLILGEMEGLTANVVTGVLQGFAAGIFLHVTFMEIIPSEFADGKHGVLKVLFLFIGFLTISAINIGQEVEQW